jgi:GNAT superfamily N-acetyltransferase
MAHANGSPHLEFHPLTPERWDDFARLFGARGACGGCWCMSWRLSRADFAKSKGERNRRAMKKLVDSGRVPGVLAYAGAEPIGWCSVAPREEFVRLETHRTLKPIDRTPVWSIVCLFISKPWRRKGVSAALLAAAADYARRRGAKVVEGYPTEPGQTLPDPFLYTGLTKSFLRAGFREVARPARTRAIMRKALAAVEAPGFSPVGSARPGPGLKPRKNESCAPFGGLEFLHSSLGFRAGIRIRAWL